MDSANLPVRTTATAKLCGSGTASKSLVKVRTKTPYFSERDYQLTSLSGGWDPESAPPVFTAKDVKSQIDQAFSNIDLTLKTAGGKGMSQVFRINSYHPNSSLEAMAAMKENLEKWFPDHRPIWTAVGVEKLAFDEMLIEIEAAAYDPQKAQAA
jgi:enamine deaminase RidA (YjgF/YER057c/UK114 family)